jgi:hypothetical protein
MAIGDIDGVSPALIWASLSFVLIVLITSDIK